MQPPKTVELAGNIAVAASSNKEERAALSLEQKNCMLCGLKGTADMPTASITILRHAAAASIQGSLHSNNAEARQKMLSFNKQQNAAEQTGRLAAAKTLLFNNVNCNWVEIGACLFPSGSNGPNLICCQAAGCKELIHHACQTEWENGGSGRETGGCNKFYVGHHPAANHFADVVKPMNRTTRAMTKAFSKEALPALIAGIVEALSDDDLEEDLKELKVSVYILSYILILTSSEFIDYANSTNLCCHFM
jgi:hypothetical protein